MSDAPKPAAGGPPKPGVILALIGAGALGLIFIGVAFRQFLTDLGGAIGDGSYELARRASEINVAKLITHDISIWILTSLIVLLFIGWAATQLRPKS